MGLEIDPQIECKGLPGQWDLHASVTNGTMSSFRNARNSLEISEKVSGPALSTHLNTNIVPEDHANAAKSPENNKTQLHLCRPCTTEHSTFG